MNRLLSVVRSRTERSRFIVRERGMRIACEAQDRVLVRLEALVEIVDIWFGHAPGLAGPDDSDTFRAILEGRVPDGPHHGKRDRDGEIHHRPGRDVAMSAPKSVSLMAMIGGDERTVDAHAVQVNWCVKGELIEAGE